MSSITREIYIFTRIGKIVQEWEIFLNILNQSTALKKLYLEILNINLNIFKNMEFVYFY